MVRSYMRHGPTQVSEAVSEIHRTRLTTRLSVSYVRQPLIRYLTGDWHTFLPGRMCWSGTSSWDRWCGDSQYWLIQRYSASSLYQLSMWHSTGLTSPVAHIAASPLPSSSTSTSSRSFAVAYNDGSIRLWSYLPSNPTTEASEIVTFNGHKKSPTTLAWDIDGSRLASGGTEGEIVVWDTVAEVGLFRLKGHRGPVTGIKFIPHPTLPVTAHPGYLISTAKDTYLKLWDLSTQHCVQTVVVGRGEVMSCDAKEELEEDDEPSAEAEEVNGRWLVITGTSDGEAKAWTLDRAALARGMKETSSGEVSFLRLLFWNDINSSLSYRRWSSRFASCLFPTQPTPSRKS